MQRVALSATVADPEGVAQRYLHQGIVVNVPGGREIVAEVVPLYDLAELVDALAQRAVQKSLVFCNSRDEVETYGPLFAPTSAASCGSFCPLRQSGCPDAARCRDAFCCGQRRHLCLYLHAGVGH